MRPICQVAINNQIRLSKLPCDYQRRVTKNNVMCNQCQNSPPLLRLGNRGEFEQRIRLRRQCAHWSVSSVSPSPFPSIATFLLSIGGGRNRKFFRHIPFSIPLIERSETSNYRNCKTLDLVVGVSEILSCYSSFNKSIKRVFSNGKWKWLTAFKKFCGVELGLKLTVDGFCHIFTLPVFQCDK